MNNLLLLSLVFVSASWAEASFKFHKGSGKVDFLALGNPSAIRIDGHSEGPEGLLTTEDNGEALVIAGDLNVDLKTSDTGILLRDRHMKEKYLETEKFRTATLTLSAVNIPKAALTGDKETILPFTGQLDLHGVKKSVSGEFSLKPSSNTLKMKASFKFKLSDHGISVPAFAGITVADSVEIRTSSDVERTP